MRYWMLILCVVLASTSLAHAGGKKDDDSERRKQDQAAEKCRDHVREAHGALLVIEPARGPHQTYERVWCHWRKSDIRLLALCTYKGCAKDQPGAPARGEPGDGYSASSEDPRAAAKGQCRAFVKRKGARLDEMRDDTEFDRVWCYWSWHPQGANKLVTPERWVTLCMPHVCRDSRTQPAVAR